MGREFTAQCLQCGTEFTVRDGGGFCFHLLHCDKCGKDKSVGFEELGEIQQKFYHSLDQPQSDQTMTRSQFNSAVSQKAGKCSCGGHFKMNAKPRCPSCHSTKLTDDGNCTAMYD